MLCASIWEEDRVGALDPPVAIRSFARVEVCPVVVVVHTILVMVRMRLLLEKKDQYKHRKLQHWFQTESPAFV